MPTESQTIIDRAMADIVNAFLKWPLPESVSSDTCCNRPGKGRIGTNLLTCPEALDMAQKVVRPIIQKLLEEHADTHTIMQRDEAEDAANKLASTILGEPIDWPDHGAKWDEALELVSAEKERIETLAAKMKKFVAENYPADGNGQVDFVRVLVEGYAAELLGQDA
jgi:hypothetical protein